MNKSKGFSFIELVVSLLFIGVSALLVSYFIQQQPSELSKQQSKARQELRLLENAVAAYVFDNQTSAPSTEQGFKDIIAQGYLSKMLVDPWGNPYQYRSPGVYGTNDYWSRGPDGIDSDDDIVGWDPYGSYVR